MGIVIDFLRYKTKREIDDILEDPEGDHLEPYEDIPEYLKAYIEEKLDNEGY